MEKYLSKSSVCYCLIGLAVVLVWGSTARFDFVWDDTILIVQNKSIQSLRYLPETLYSLDAQSAETAPSYRPLRTAHYAILKALTGTGPARSWIFHLASVVWHAVAAMLLFSVALLLFERQACGISTCGRMAALWTALAFAVHPVTSETICWVKCLDDLMATVYVLAATRALLKWNQNGNICWPALVYFLLSVYGKESAAPFALVAFFIFHWFHGLPWRKSLALCVPFLAVAVIYVAHRHLVLGRSSQCAPLSGTYGQTLIDMFPVVAPYLRLLFGVPPFCIDYDYMIGLGNYAFLSRQVLCGLLLILLWIGVAVWLARRTAFRVVAFGMIWAALFLLPVSNIVPMMQYMAERFLYLPLVGFLIAFAALACRISALHKFWWVGAAVLLIWVASSINRRDIWQNELTLFIRSGLEMPGNRRVEKNALVAIFHLPQMEKLFPEYRKNKTLVMAESLTMKEVLPAINTLIEAHRIFPHNDLLCASLGLTYAHFSQWPQALGYLELAVRESGDSPRSWYNLSSVRLAANDPVKASVACEQALALDPRFAEALQLQIKIRNALNSAPSK